MQHGLFYSLGLFIYRARWLWVLFWLIVVLCCIPFSTQLMKPFKSIDFKDVHLESTKASQLLYKTLGYSDNNFIIVYKSEHPFSSHPEYLAEIKNSLNRLNEFPIKNKVIYPTTQNHQISIDDHAAYASVLVNTDKNIGPDLVKKFKELIKPQANFEIQVGGLPVFVQDTQIQAQRDLSKNEFIATPIALITMLLVFGTIVAGFLPIILGGIAVFLTFVTLYILGHFFVLSVFTLNIALLLITILFLDYALLIISRYYEELEHRNSTNETIAIAVATAGKSVFFSSLAILSSISALMLFHVDVIFSAGMAGLCAALIAMIVSLTLLPAVLSILQWRINLLPLLRFKKTKAEKSPWHGAIANVVKRRWIFAITLLFFLLALGFPFLHVHLGTSDYRALPKGNSSRDFFDFFANKFDENKLNPIFLIVQSKNKNILEKSNLSALYDFVDTLKKDRNIKEINSIVSVNSQLTKQQYQMMYGQKRLPQELKNSLQFSTKDNLTVITLISNSSNYAKKTQDLIEKLKNIKSNDKFNFLLTGNLINTYDVKQSILKTFPYAFLWIVFFTYIILLFFSRSVILPLKAILTNILSLCASYGVLVVVFQEGYLHHLLNFDKQGILDITLLVIIFSVLFGVSIDYEVFLLARIKEYYEKTKDNTRSIIFGIERSSKIITSAAVIVILVCLSFVTADTIMMKEFGLGIAVAVFIDAFIIRILFVPSVMTLLGKWNWYSPNWLKKIIPNIHFDASTEKNE